MKKRKPEFTSARIAKIAARILATDGDFGWVTYCDGHDLTFDLHWDELRAVCASALTQTAPKKKKNGRVSIGKYRYRRRSIVKNPRKRGGK